MAKNKILIAFAVIAVIVIGLVWASNSTDEVIENNSQSSVTDESSKEQTSTSSEEKTESTICQKIDDSDVVVQLNLPEEYAHYKDANIFPSYETGFMFKSSYGDVASSRRLAKKDCNYRVGFNKDDFDQLNLNPNYPLVVFAYKDASNDFTYQNEPLKISIGANGLPEQGSEFILKVTGVTQSFGHFDTIFE